MPETITPENVESEWKKKHEQFLVDLAELLPPCVADEVNIKLQIKRLLEVEEKLRQAEIAKEKVQEESEQKATELLKKISDLETKVETQKTRNDTLQVELDKLRIQVQGMQSKYTLQKIFKPILSPPTPSRKRKSRFRRFWERFM